jgi:flavin-dependent dehydrogenase
VHLVAKPPGPGKLAVSLPPSCIKLFDACGVTAAINRAGFIRSTGNTVWWGTDQPRVEFFQGDVRGWQADLQQFSDVLREQATSDLIRVTASVAPELIADAALVLDCTGRAGVIAKDHRVREYDAGPRTVGLVGEWRTGASWSLPDDTHTIIESYRDGWMWSVPTAPGVRHVSAMIDPQRSELARGGSPRGVYLNEIGKTRQFKQLLGDARLTGGPWGWDATPYRSREYAGANWILVGDAASFIDPLSSAGVQKALASAWLAAIVANTCVSRPMRRSDALAFFAARERQVEARYSSAARLFLTAAAREHREAFWADRVVEIEHRAEATAEVQAAFERLKAAPELRVRVSPDITISPRPYIDGHEIAIGDHIVSGDRDSGTRYLHNVNVPALIELAPRVTTVEELLTTYLARCGAVDLHDFLMGLSTVIARRWLVSE